MSFLDEVLDFVWVGKSCPECKEKVMSISQNGREVVAQCGHRLADFKPIVRKKDKRHERGAG